MRVSVRPAGANWILTVTGRPTRFAPRIIIIGVVQKAPALSITLANRAHTLKGRLASPYYL